MVIKDTSYPLQAVLKMPDRLVHTSQDQSIEQFYVARKRPSTNFLRLENCGRVGRVKQRLCSFLSQVLMSGPTLRKLTVSSLASNI